MTDNQNPQTAEQPATLTDQQRLRLRQAIEVAVFLCLGIVFYHYGPFWVVDPVINLTVTTGFVFLLFVCYLAFRSGTGKPTQQESEDTVADPATEQAPPNRLPFDLRKYQVPRKFSLGSLVVLMVIFALLTVGLQSLGASPVAVMLTIGFFSTVACMQAVMQRVPRIASCVVGAVYVIALSPSLHLNLWLTEVFRMSDSMMTSVFAILLGATLGVILGYVAGTLSAGVVLAGELLTTWWRGHRLEFS